MLIWLTAALLVLAYWIASLVRASRAAQVIPDLKSLPLPESESVLPKLTVIVPARNEGAGIEPCLRSLAAQDYPELEIIAVDDRSTDNTGEVMDRLGAEFPAPPPAEAVPAVETGEGAAPQPEPVLPSSHRPYIIPLHITELPEGWLGKCNALAQGAAKATGDVILFTDGDVVFDPTALRRSVAYLNARDADMMVVMPDILTGSFLEQVMILVFGHSMMTAFPPAKAMDRRSNVFVGVGAFNMIRKKYYQRIHGHRFLRLQVVDDAGLGKLVKHSGGTICVAFGGGMVRVRWQESLWGVIRGLEKNAFAALRYSKLRTVVASLGLLFIYWWPWIGAFVGPTSARVLCATAALCHVLVGIGASRYIGFSRATGLFLPIGALLLAFTLLRSMVITLRQGGIRWRDSFYSLRDLRQFKL